MITDVLFEFYRGDTYTRDFTLTGWGLPISKVYFTVKEKVEDKNAVLQKKLGEGITLVEETEEGKTFNLTICCTDTDDLKAEYDYIFDIEIQSIGENGDVIKKTIITGTMNLIASSTRTCNEC
jgi:hypothetical protein